MFEIIRYLKNRYLTEKAQGITEYALLLVFVVTVAIAVLFNENNSLQTAITAAFNKVNTLITNKGNVTP